MGCCATKHPVHQVIRERKYSASNKILPSDSMDPEELEFRRQSGQQRQPEESTTNVFAAAPVLKSVVVKKANSSLVTYEQRQAKVLNQDEKEIVEDGFFKSELKIEQRKNSDQDY